MKEQGAAGAGTATPVISQIWVCPAKVRILGLNFGRMYLSDIRDVPQLPGQATMTRLYPVDDGLIRHTASKFTPHFQELGVNSTEHHGEDTLASAHS